MVNIKTASTKYKEQSTNRCTLLRASLALSMFSALARRRLAVRRFRARRSSSETTNHSLRSVRWLHSRSNHLRKQVNIIVRFARHVFSNRVQNFQKFWPSIHFL